VVAAAQAAGGLPVSDGVVCAPDLLMVSYDDPGDGYGHGAHVMPLGPPPRADTTAVNGVLLCTGSQYAYAGFEAIWDTDHWVVGLVPDPEEDGHNPNAVPETPSAADPPPPPAPATDTPALTDTGKYNGSGIEGFARYEPQTTCDPSAKVGAIALRNLLLKRYPVTKSLGISRECSAAGTSEHKEGRAFDWGALVTNPAQKAAVEDFYGRLFAKDDKGNQFALARRMGVMYLIWNHKIWSSYRADAGWRAYSGSNPHTDHMHISMSWAGARAQTSYWSGKVVDGLLPTPVGGGDSGGNSGGNSGKKRSPREIAMPPTTTQPHERRRRYVSMPTTTTQPVNDGLRFRRRGDRVGTGPATTTTTRPVTTTTTRRPWTTTTTTRPPTTTTTRAPTTTTTRAATTTTTAGAAPVTTTTQPTVIK
jgi:hypothetical protein